MEEKSTNLAWPTPRDSDVPPAEKRANHIHTYSLMVAREQSLLSEGETTIARTNPQSLRLSSRCTTRVDDNGDQADTANQSDVTRLYEILYGGLACQDRRSLHVFSHHFTF